MCLKFSCLNSSALTQLLTGFFSDLRLLNHTWSSAHIARLRAPCDLWAPQARDSLGRYKNFAQTAIWMFEQEKTQNKKSSAVLTLTLVYCLFLFRFFFIAYRLKHFFPTRLRWVSSSTTSVCNERSEHCYGVVCLNGSHGSCIKAESWNRGHAAIFQRQRGSLALTRGGCVINP